MCMCWEVDVFSEKVVWGDEKVCGTLTAGTTTNKGPYGRTRLSIGSAQSSNLLFFNEFWINRAIQMVSCMRGRVYYRVLEGVLEDSRRLLWEDSSATWINRAIQMVSVLCGTYFLLMNGELHDKYDDGGEKKKEKKQKKKRRRKRRWVKRCVYVKRADWKGVVFCFVRCTLMVKKKVGW